MKFQRNLINDNNNHMKKYGETRLSGNMTQFIEVVVLGYILVFFIANFLKQWYMHESNSKKL